MKIKELIEQLQKYPDNLRVLVNGYEMGYDDFEINTQYISKIYPEPARWAGDYKKDDAGEYCVILSRKQK